MTLQQIDSVLAAYAPDHIAGISNPCKEADFPKGLHQALDAHEVGKVTDSRITYYNELSVYKLLMPLWMPLRVPQYVRVNRVQLQLMRRAGELLRRGNIPAKGL